jgi:hypothetical protein
MYYCDRATSEVAIGGKLGVDATKIRRRVRTPWPTQTNLKPLWGRNMPLLTELEPNLIAQLQRCRPEGALVRERSFSRQHV